MIVFTHRIRIKGLAVTIGCFLAMGGRAAGPTDFISTDHTPREFNDPTNWTSGLPDNHGQNDMTNEAAAYLSANYAPPSPGFRLSLSPDPGKTITLNLNGYKLENVADAFGLRGWRLNDGTWTAANANVVISNGFWRNAAITFSRLFYSATAAATNNNWILSNVKADLHTIYIGSEAGHTEYNSLHLADASVVTARADVVVGTHSSYNTKGIRLRIASNCTLRAGNVYIGRGSSTAVRTEIGNQGLVQGPNAKLLVTSNLVVGGFSGGISTVTDCLLLIADGGYAEARDVTIGFAEPGSTKPVTNNSVVVTGALSRLWVTNGVYVGLSTNAANSRVSILANAVMAITNAFGTASMTVSNGHITIQGGGRLIVDHLTLQNPSIEQRIELTSNARTNGVVSGSGAALFNGTLFLTGTNLDSGVYKIFDFSTGSGALAGVNTNFTFLPTRCPDPSFLSLGIAGLDVNIPAGRVDYHVIKRPGGTVLSVR